MVFHFQFVQLGLDAPVLLARVAQRDITLDKPHRAAATDLDHLGKRRHGRDGPNADHAHIAAILNLVSQEHKLGEYRQQEGRDVAVTNEHSEIPNRIPSLSRFFSTAENRSTFCPYPALRWPADRPRSTPADQSPRECACRDFSAALL